jgi:hypothetical protein
MERCGQHGVGHDGGLRSCRGTGTTGVGEAPDAATAFAGQEQADGSGAPVVGAVPTATAFIALAGAQVRRSKVAAGMPGPADAAGRTRRPVPQTRTPHHDPRSTGSRPSRPGGPGRPAPRHPDGPRAARAVRGVSVRAVRRAVGEELLQLLLYVESSESSGRSHRPNGSL